jgi:hypothetical protein
MSRSIRLSDAHGVNPAIPLCFFCNKPKNEIILAGRLPGDREALRNAVWNKEPCDECAGYMKQGIICISTRDGEGGDNPYRTGAWIVLREEAMRRFVQPEALAEEIARRRVAFIPDEVWNALGLPRGEVGDAST